MNKFYKYCIVPQCGSTTIKTPNKLFIYVPKKKHLRKKWLKLARREPNLSIDSRLYFCEDHFDLPNDMDNYMEYHVMGSVSQIRLKPGHNPSKFYCQPDRRKRTCKNLERPYILKKQRKLIIEECLNKSLKNTSSTSLVPEATFGTNTDLDMVEDLQEACKQEKNPYFSDLDVVEDLQDACKQEIKPYYSDLDMIEDDIQVTCKEEINPYFSHLTTVDDLEVACKQEKNLYFSDLDTVEDLQVDCKEEKKIT